MSTQLPDLTHASRWNKAAAMHRAVVAADEEKQLEQQRLKIAGQLANMLLVGKEYLFYCPDSSDAIDRSDKRLMVRLRDWVRSHPGYRCRMRWDDYHCRYELHIRFKVINGTVQVRRPWFFFRWFC